jgi:hypothetical protein
MMLQNRQSHASREVLDMDVVFEANLFTFELSGRNSRMSDAPGKVPCTCLPSRKEKQQQSRCVFGDIFMMERQENHICLFFSPSLCPCSMLMGLLLSV